MRRAPLLLVALGALALPSSALAAPPPNDAFAAAQVLTGETPEVRGTIREATVEPGEPEHAGVGSVRSVWYSYTPSANAEALVVDACDANFDDVLAVYTGGPGVNQLTEITSVDDACELGARVTLAASAGTTYYIAVSGFADSQGEFTLRIGAAQRPRNDAFADAITFRGPGRITGTNELATRELGEPSAGRGASVWYRWRAPRSQQVTFDTFGSSFDTILGVYVGDLGRLRRIALNDDAGGTLDSRVRFRARRGVTYWILVDSYGSGTGEFVLGLFDGSARGAGLTLSLERGQTTASAIESGLRGRVTCGRPCRLRLSATIGPRTARRIGLPRSERTIARLRGRLTRAGVRTAILQLSREAQRALRGEDGVAVTVRAVLEGGTRSRAARTVTRRVTLG